MRRYIEAYPNSIQITFALQCLFNLLYGLLLQTYFNKLSNQNSLLNLPLADMVLGDASVMGVTLTHSLDSFYRYMTIKYEYVVNMILCFFLGSITL